MTPVIATTKKRDFDPTKFLTTIGEGRKIVPVAKKQTIYAQGAACDPLNWGGRRAGLRRHQPREGTLLDRCHQRIISSLPSRRNPGRRFGQETDAGPTELPLGMDRRGDHDSGNVRRGRRHVCCVDYRISLPRNRTLAGQPRPAF